MGRKQKRIFTVLLSLAIVIAVLLVLQSYWSQEAYAEATLSDEMKEMIELAKDADFTILEIVPDKAMAEIGYSVDGSEPIDLEWACVNGEAWNICSFGDYDMVSPWKITVNKYEEYKKKGDKYCKDSKGENVWTRMEDAKTGEVYYQCKYPYAKNKDTFRKCLPEIITGTIKVITVTPKELNDAAKANNYELLENSELINIQGNIHQGDTVTTLWNKYNVEGEAPSSLKQTFTNNDLDWSVTMELFKRLVVDEKRASLIMDIILYNNMPTGTTKNVDTRQYKVGNDGKLVLTDNHNGSAGSNNNVYKLCLMLHQRDPFEFYEIFIKKGYISNSGDYLLQTGDAAKYWSPYTFLPAKADGSQANKDDWNAIGINTEGGNNISVIDNIYTYNGENCLTKRFNEDMINRKDWSNQDNPYLKEMFEYYDDKLTKTTPAKAVEYIIRNSGERKMELTKENIRILELQPCKDFNFESSVFVTRLRSLGAKVEIVKQTTAEFIGQIEDINSNYDMVYIGTNTGGLNTTTLTNGKVQTVYNDSNLTGKIYLHVGDLIPCKGINLGYALRGLISTAYDGRYRYSGNDITSRKRQDLANYVKAGYPIMLANQLYKMDVNAIDDSSYLFAFVKGQVAKSNVCLIDTYNLSHLTTKAHNEMVTLLNKSKSKLVITTKPKEYSATFNESTKKLNMVYNDTGKKIQFRFHVEDADYSTDHSITYAAKLYIDTSGDGYYSSDEVVATRKSFIPSKEIGLTTSLETDYKGVLCWKLVVYRTDNDAVRDDEEGVTAIQSTTGKEKIKILQINTLRHQMNWTDSTLNLQNELEKQTSNFYKYIKGLSDFDITIHTITVDTFKVNNASWAVDGKTYYRKNIINDYDMLIFGFGDSYKDIESTDAMKDVQAYIDSGQSVLFTHDTTSQNNEWGRNENALNIVTDSGFYFNQFLRTAMGMNRFGVLPVPTNVKASTTEQVKYKTAMEELSAKIEAVKASSDSIFDTARNPSQLPGSRYPEIQGFTYTALMQFTHIPRALTNSGAGYDVNFMGPYKGLKVNSVGTSNGFIDITKGYVANKVTKVNDGQITRYPYAIPDQIDITDTHGQYYQLNMEDPEIVVWYCLSNVQNSDATKNWYSISPNDVSNNYYIYNKGNITYSGVGHLNIASNENEVKLFVNTMIAAYKTSINNPEVVITNGTFMEETNETYLYSDISAGETIDAGAVVPVTFETYSNNKNIENLYVKVYNEAGDDVTESVKILAPNGAEIAKSNLSYNGTTMTVKQVEVSTDTLKKEYTLNYPAAELSSKGKVNFTIRVYTSGLATSYANGVLLMRNLFDLD
ncbi:MAG TPA: DUF5057 domain-containing protein [Lachnospiraceae bacterium]|nr:DUF5057 domain-containing protein [Lachnospiraceae bacterium]